MWRWTGSSYVDITAANGLAIASQAEAEAGTENTKAMTSLRVAQQFAAGSYKTTIGNGTDASYTISHGLGTADLIVDTLDDVGGNQWAPAMYDIVISNSTVVVTSATPIPTNSVRVLIRRV